MILSNLELGCDTFDIMFKLAVEQSIVIYFLFLFVQNYFSWLGLNLAEFDQTLIENLPFLVRNCFAVNHEQAMRWFSPSIAILT